MKDVSNETDSWVPARTSVPAITYPSKPLSVVLGCFHRINRIGVSLL
jgi:hypothetical protein